MNKILETLYAAIEEGRRSEAGTQAVEASKEAVRAAEQHLTYEEFDNLWNAISGIGRADELDSFALGFRLGVQLTLEGLRPIEWSAP